MIDAVAADSSLAPVVITATREPEVIGRSTADIVVIDADDDPQHERGLGRGPDPPRRRHAARPQRRARARARASSSAAPNTNSTVVLVDGVRVGSATLGQAEFEAFSLAQIERIEVLRGPASSLYGADAVGGVVQIFTRRGEGAPRANAAAEVGGYHSFRGDAGASGAVGPWDYALSLGHEESRGVSAIAPGDQFGQFNPDADGFKRDSGTLRLGFTPAPGHRIGVHLLETRLNAQYDAPSRPSSTTPRPTFAIGWSRGSPRSTTAASRPARGRRRSRPRARSTT